MIAKCVKLVAFMVCAVLTAPLILLANSERWLRAGESLFTTFSQLLALVPGVPGVLLRGAYYAFTLERCSWETHVGFGTIFSRRGASIGRHASMGAYCVIGNASIGARAMIGSRVSIPSGSRQHFDDEGRLAHGTGVFDRVAIGEECWIGEGAVVMADVGPRSIVSAGSIVARPVAGGVIVAGNPARVIRQLDAAPEDGA